MDNHDAFSYGGGPSAGDTFDTTEDHDWTGKQRFENLALDVTGFFSSISFATTQDDLAHSQILHFLVPDSGDQDITGLQWDDDGDLAILFNISDDYTLTLKHEDSNSSTTNRFDCPNEEDYALPPHSGVMLVHGNPSRWQVVARPDENTQNSRWTEVSTNAYTATPSADDTIAMSDTSAFYTGAPVKFEDSDGPFYAMCTGITTDTSITIAGAPLDTGDDLTSLSVGRPEMLVPISMDPPEKLYGASAADINHGETWRGPDAFLVAYSAWHEFDDTGASNPKVNLEIEGSAVSTEDSNNGVTVASAETETLNGAVEIDTANYQLTYGDTLKAVCTAAGTNGDAEYVHIDIYMVLA